MTAIVPYIRWLIRRDMPEILAIENASFDWPWTPDEFVWCLSNRNHIGMIAEDGEIILGYMVYVLYHKKISLMNLAVHPGYLRRGIGTAMIARLTSKLTSQRRKRIVTLVGENNLAAQLFFQAQGFVATKIHRQSSYDELDQYEMQYHLSWNGRGGFFVPRNRVSHYLHKGSQGC